MTPFRFLPLLLAGIFALASLPALSASEHSSGAKRQGHHGDMPRCKNTMRHGGMHHDGKHHGGMRHKGWRRGPDALAERLTLLETKIGIRANQLDAWRDYTDALQAMMKHPQLPGGPRAAEEQKAEPFGRIERYAEMAASQAGTAKTLLTAIENLRRTLTPEQLAKVSEIEAGMRPHGRHSGGPSRRGPERADRDSDHDSDSDSTDDSDSGDGAEPSGDGN